MVKMKIFIMFLILIMGLGVINAEPITFSKFSVNETTICSDKTSYISIFAEDSDGLSISIDGIIIEMSLNISGQITENTNRSIFTIIINNITEEYDGTDFLINITGSQGGYVVKENRTLEIVKCNNWKDTFSDKVNRLENLFYGNFIYLILYLITILLIVFLVILMKTSKK